MWLTKPSGKPFWQVRFLHPDGSGRRISISTRETGKRAARAKADELVADYLKGWEREQVGGRVTALQVIEEYWNTEAHRHKSAKDHILPHLERITQFLGERAYCDVTIADVARFADEMTTTHSDSTINRALSVWRRMHNVAAKKRLYPVNVIDWSQVRRQEPEPADCALSRDEFKAILEHLPERGREIAVFGIFTGIRKTQILDLEWSRVDLNARTVQVYRKHRKAYALHTVHLHPSAVKVLEARLRVRDGEKVFDATNHRLEWETALRRANLGRQVRFHDLRHTYASWLAQGPLHIVQKQLGHSTIAVTMRYAKATESEVKASVAAIPEID